MSKSLYRKSDRLRLLEDEPFSNNLEFESYRSSFRRDYARLIHSPSFRRLQGKTQLFPGVESDFFRNRLTHSMEVAQIAKSIAIRLNALYNTQGGKRKKGDRSFGIDTDLVEFAGLAHDLGHPPFGHQGEAALDELMYAKGGFEGNAQTLRLLYRIEKKFDIPAFDNGKDSRVGLNLCMRTLASVLKYDKPIPVTEGNRDGLCDKLKVDRGSVMKGYYSDEKDLIIKIKESVAGNTHVKEGDFKTIECCIMDIADDIAYSTYDLEDGLKAGFISPLDLLYPEEDFLASVTEKVNKNLKKEGVKRVMSAGEVRDFIHDEILPFGKESELVDSYPPETLGKHFIDFASSVFHQQYNTAKVIAKNGSIRTGFTSSIVGRLVRGVELKYNDECPALSKAVLTDNTRIMVEILKTFTYLSQIDSPRLKIAEVRGQDILFTIFEYLDDGGMVLLPEDVQELVRHASGDYKDRLICDFIASMTDRYAIEFYGRLTSEDPQTIFKPF